MHKEFNSLCMRHPRFPFWRSLGATIGTKRWQDKNKISANFFNLALPEVSNAAFDKQKNSPPADHHRR
jgi:hypothetical protein